MSEGVYAATHYAARHPERVTHLITYGGGVSSNKVEAAAWEEQAELFVRIILQGWGSETPAYRQLFANLFLGPGAPPEDLQYFCEMQRVSAPANRAAQYLESLVEDGVEESARAVHVPTMVVTGRRGAHPVLTFAAAGGAHPGSAAAHTRRRQPLAAHRRCGRAGLCARHRGVHRNAVAAAGAGTLTGGC